MPSLKNTTRQNSASSRIPLPNKPFKKLSILFLSVLCLGAVSSCEPTYPSRSLTKQLTDLVKKEENLDVTTHIVGKTLWVYLPSNSLVKDETATWDIKGLEEINKALSVAHRVILSTDAKIDFLVLDAVDVKQYGVELKVIEHIPDIREAILEKFSRGEFFLRSIRDVGVNPDLVGDLTGKSQKFYDVSFNQFIALQIIYRVKNLFLNDKVLSRIFEVRSSAWSEKFGIIKINLEFLKKKYDLTEEEEKIRPLDYAKMVTALVVTNYNYQNFQVLEITDTFAEETIKSSFADLKNVKISLPEFLD